MSFEFDEFTFDELKAPSKGAFAMGPFGSRIKAENFVAEGVPVIKGGNLNGDYLNEATFDYLTTEKANELSASIARKGDIVVTHRGTLGQVGIIPNNSEYSEYIVSQSQLKLSFDTERVNPYFIYYFLRSSLGQQRLLANTSQVGVPAIAQALTTMKGIKVPLPNLAIQNQIVETLRSLDDRIALLRETNATLEAIAQALFKSWFVDFDPVHAKQQGRAPEGMDEATAALFPDSFEESELGLVPRGWRPQRLESFIELAYGKALKSSDRVSGEVPVYGSGGITGYHNESLTNGPSVIVGRKGTVGSLYWEDLPFFPIDTVFYVRTKAPMTYCFYLLQTLGLTGMNTDGAVPGLNRNNVYRLLVVLPSSDVLKAFDDVVKVIRNRVFQNQQQAQTLATLRDTLLPRLISGQLRLPEAETLVREAA
jgi:type I restriction enzyme S subunit